MTQLDLKQEIKIIMSYKHKNAIFMANTEIGKLNKTSITCFIR